MKLKRPRSVMVVEDDPAFLDTLRQFMTLYGFDPVLCASDGAAAWERLETEPVDLLITDVNMPRMNGLELMGRVRQVHQDLPIIVISGFLEKAHLSQLDPYRVRATIFKPFRMPVIAEEIRKVFEEDFAE